MVCNRFDDLLGVAILKLKIEINSLIALFLLVILFSSAPVHFHIDMGSADNHFHSNILFLNDTEP